MEFSQVIKFEGSVNDLVWKSKIEDFNTTSQLIVDETHEALLVVNGNACDLFGPGRHTLETGNIPLLQKIINIPTGGKTSFPCKVFYIYKVHQMDMRWGIPGDIALNDPIYDVFMHIGMKGNMYFKISDSRKFVLKAVGFRDHFTNEEMVDKFRGIIRQYAKDAVAKAMISGKKSYFDISENLFEMSQLVREKISPVFDDYGIEILEFNIEAVNAPDEDYAIIKKAKEARTARAIQGFTWQEEKQMEVAKTFAANEGGMGGVAGTMGGFMMGTAMSGGMADMVRNTMGAPAQNPGYYNGYQPGMPVPPSPMGMQPNMQPAQPAQPEAAPAGKFCIKCGNPLAAEMIFCPKCGTKQGNECSNCHTPLAPGAAFCHVCGTPCQ